VAEPVAALLALALALAPVPADSTAVNDEPGEPPTAAPDVPDAPDVPAVPEASAPVVEGPEEAPTPAATPGGLCHGSRPCKRLVALASVSGGLGLAAIVAGGVLAARPQRVDPDDPTKAITYRPAGSAALAIGLGVLATGVLMAVAAVRASRLAKQGATRTAWLQRDALVAW
jgi:hypothetical protein